MDYERARGGASIEPLGQFCSALRIADLPPAAVGLASWKILDSVACAFLAADSEVAAVCRQLSPTLGTGPASSVLGASDLAAADAAFVNSATIHALLQDDVDLTIGHPACTVIPAALALGELSDASGDSVIAAIVAGYEAMWRIGGRGTWMIPTIQRGFRGNTILGAFGAAAAGARVLGLDGAATAQAIGAAASFAAGLLAPLNAGTMERSFQQANNSRAGVLSVLLVAAGMDGHVGVLAGEGGFYRCFMGEDALPADAMDDLGQDLYLDKSFSKPYPSAGSNTVGIAVMEELVRRHDLASEDIDAIDVEVVQRFTGKPGYPAIAAAGPFTQVEETLISFPFGLACMAKYREVDLPALRRGLDDPEAADLATKVNLIATDVPHPLWCRITVRTAGADTLVATSDEIDWSGFYLTEEAAVGKFERAAPRFLEPAESASFVQAILNLPQCTSVREPLSLLGRND